MQANSPVPAPPPIQLPPNGGKNPYDFIMDTKHTKKGLFAGGGSLKSRLTTVLIGTGVLIVIAMLAVSLIAGGGRNGQTDSLVNLAQQENEIIRIAELGSEKASSTLSKNLAITTELSIKTNQADTLALLGKSGHELSPEDLNLLRSSQTDKELESAEAANTFDDTFTKLIKVKLSAYRTSLQSVFRISTSLNEKQLLQTNFNHATLLLGTQST